MRFAARTDFGPEASAYGQALEQARARGGLLDLTVSNPTRCGFSYPPGLLHPLSDEASLRYDPEPFGIFDARNAVAAMYRDRYAAEVSPENVLLTASTSEAYSYLLRLFCEPGDAILVPSPSYPLFDLLARLHDVEVVTYPLVYHDGWQIDPASFRAALTPRTRAIVAIHPNNPTGHYCSDLDRDLLRQCAAEHNLPLIVDEVFLDYPVESQTVLSFAARTGMPRDKDGDPVLTFVLGGLSKLLCLPQVKLAWTVFSGPPEDVSDAMRRLEVIADTFLSVSTPPQIALPRWLAEDGVLRRQVLDRVQANLRWLDTALRGTVFSRLRVEGGWAVVLRTPANDLDIDAVIRLLNERGVALHPGSFYGFPPRGWLVSSLITPPAVFQHGITRLLASV